MQRAAYLATALGTVSPAIVMRLVVFTWRRGAGRVSGADIDRYPHQRDLRVCPLTIGGMDVAAGLHSLWRPSSAVVDGCPMRTDTNQSDVSTFPRKTARCAPLGSLPSRTNWSRMQCARCWRQHTSRTLWTARIAAGPDAARTMQYVRSKGQWMEDEPTGFWRRITSPSSTSFNEDATPRCSGGAKITGPVRNQVTLREAVPSVASE